MKQSVLNSLKYYHYFNFPLRTEEVLNWCEKSSTKDEIESILKELEQENRIAYSDDYWGIAPLEPQISMRKRSEERHAKLWPSIMRSGRIIASFPFVKMVAISGTASKGVMGEDSDFDYFIVCEANKMWVSRTILHLFKKITFLFGKEHQFCMNYFKDERKLEIEEESLFTATELYTLIPIYGHELYESLISSNNWIEQTLPNANVNKLNVGVRPIGWLKMLLQLLTWPISFPAANRFFMNWTYRKWRKKWKKKGFDMKQFDISFKTSLLESKNHPSNMAVQLDNFLED